MYSTASCSVGIAFSCCRVEMANASERWYAGSGEKTTVVARRAAGVVEVPSAPSDCCADATESKCATTGASPYQHFPTPFHLHATVKRQQANRCVPGGGFLIASNKARAFSLFWKWSRTGWSNWLIASISAVATQNKHCVFFWCLRRRKTTGEWHLLSTGFPRAILAKTPPLRQRTNGTLCHLPTGRKEGRQETARKWWMES